MADRSLPAMNVPEVRDEVTRCFLAYDAALLAHNVQALDQWFFDGPQAARFGLGEELYGTGQITAWRRSAPPPRRSPLRRYDVTTLGTDVAVVTAEFDEAADTGRQSQAWVRSETGWRVLTGHVSIRAGAGPWQG